MRKVLVLEGRPEKIEELRPWIERNYPEGSGAEVTWESNLVNVVSKEILRYNVIMFTGKLGNFELINHLKISPLWVGKLFVALDELPETKKFLTALRKAGIQVMQKP